LRGVTFEEAFPVGGVSIYAFLMMRGIEWYRNISRKVCENRYKIENSRNYKGAFPVGGVSIIVFLLKREID
jgi:hypothetical protein